jgi:hypothetical protein
LTTHSGYIRLSTQGDGDVCPLSERVAAIVSDSGAEGTAIVSVVS